MLDFDTLSQQNCAVLSKSSTTLIIPTIESYLSILPEWQPGFDYNSIERTISFKNHYQLMAFLNALAYIVHQQDHHPEITFCDTESTIRLASKITKGLTLNDMIMAARINKLLQHG